MSSTRITETFPVGGTFPGDIYLHTARKAQHHAGAITFWCQPGGNMQARRGTAPAEGMPRRLPDAVLQLCLELAQRGMPTSDFNAVQRASLPDWSKPRDWPDALCGDPIAFGSFCVHGTACRAEKDVHTPRQFPGTCSAMPYKLYDISLELYPLYIHISIMMFITVLQTARQAFTRC